MPFHTLAKQAIEEMRTDELLEAAEDAVDLIRMRCSVSVTYKDEFEAVLKKLDKAIFNATALELYTR